MTPDCQTIGDLIPIANNGAYANGYNNETYPHVVYEASRQRYAIVWQMFPNSTLERSTSVFDSRYQMTTCTDIALRYYKPGVGLSTIISDLARYTPSSDLGYDWSCQFEPRLFDFADDTIGVVWMDHRERYSRVDGLPVEKDIYAALINDQSLLSTSILVSKKSQSEERLPFKQEFPDIVDNTIFWIDDRNGVDTRQIYARKITKNNETLVIGAETSIDFGTMVRADKINNKTIVVWETRRETNYGVSFALLNENLQLVAGPKIILEPFLSRWATRPDVACSRDGCVILYGHNNELKATLVDINGDILQTIVVDKGRGYPAIINLADTNTYAIAWLDSNTLRFAILKHDQVRIPDQSSRPKTGPPSNPNPTEILFDTPINTPTLTLSPQCVCLSNNLCHQSCPVNQGENYWSIPVNSEVFYSNPMKCFPSNLSIFTTPTISSQSFKNEFCNRVDRPRGDVDGDGNIYFLTDFMTYVNIVSLNKIPTILNNRPINPDVNGDGLINNFDCMIILNNLQR